MPFVTPTPLTTKRSDKHRLQRSIVRNGALQGFVDCPRSRSITRMVPLYCSEGNYIFYQLMLALELYLPSEHRPPVRGYIFIIIVEAPIGKRRDTRNLDVLDPNGMAAISEYKEYKEQFNATTHVHTNKLMPATQQSMFGTTYSSTKYYSTTDCKILHCFYIRRTTIKNIQYTIVTKFVLQNHLSNLKFHILTHHSLNMVCVFLLFFQTKQ